MKQLLAICTVCNSWSDKCHSTGFWYLWTNHHHAEINSSVCRICLYHILCNKTCMANMKACILTRYRLKSTHDFPVVYNFLSCQPFIAKWIQSEINFDLIPSGNEPGTNQSPFQIVSYLFDRLLTEICFHSTYSRISPAGFFTPDRLSLMKTRSRLLWISTAGKYVSKNVTEVRKR